MYQKIIDFKEDFGGEKPLKREVQTMPKSIQKVIVLGFPLQEGPEALFCKEFDRNLEQFGDPVPILRGSEEAR